MSFFPTRSPAGNSKCSSSPIHGFEPILSPQIEKIIASSWRHNGEWDCHQLPMAQYLVDVEWTSDICLFTKPQPPPRHHRIHFGFPFSISLPSPGGWTPSPRFPATDMTLCQRTIWTCIAAIHLIVIIASAWSLLPCAPAGRASGHSQIWALA